MFSLTVFFLPSSFPSSLCGCCAELKEGEGEREGRREGGAEAEGPGPFNEHPHPSLPLSISLPLSADAYSKAPPTPTPTQLTTTGTFQVFYQRRSEHGKHVMQRHDQTTDGCKALHLNARMLWKGESLTFKIQYNVWNLDYNDF